MRNYNVESYEKHGDSVTINIHNFEKATRHVILKNEKDKVKFIKNCENLIRGSEEYRDWIQYLKKYKNMNKCAIFQNLDTETMKKIKLEIHHGPFSLYDIVAIVTQKYIKEDIPLDYFDVSDEVMRLHYENKIGLIPLSKTVHKLVHDGRIFIPLQAYYAPAIIGFVKEYEEYMEDYKEVFRDIIAASKKIADAGEQDLSIFNRRYVYLKIDGVELPHVIETENKGVEEWA